MSRAMFLLKIMSVRFVIAVEQLAKSVWLLYHNLAGGTPCHVVAVALETA